MVPARTSTAGLGADTIDGGADNDTYASISSQIGANAEGAGTGTTQGLVVNLTGSAITNASVFSTTGKYISGSLTTVAAGSTAYVFAAESSLNSTVADTLTSIKT